MAPLACRVTRLRVTKFGLANQQVRGDSRLRVVRTAVRLFRHGTAKRRYNVLHDRRTDAIAQQPDLIAPISSGQPVLRAEPHRSL